MTRERQISDEQYTNAVAAAFNQRGVRAEAWMTGGNVWNVAVFRPHNFWLLGIGDLSWGGVCYDNVEAHEYQPETDRGGIETLISTDDLNYSQVVERLLRMINEHQEERGSGWRSVWVHESEPDTLADDEVDPTLQQLHEPTVAQSVKGWWGDMGLEDDILDLHIATHCGEACLRVLLAAEALIAALEQGEASDAEGPALAREAAITFCRVKTIRRSGMSCGTSPTRTANLAWCRCRGTTGPRSATRPTWRSARWLRNSASCR